MQDSKTLYSAKHRSGRRSEQNGFEEPMKVLGICSYPVEAAATRFRMTQFVESLREYGVELTIRPFMDSRQFRDFYSDSGRVRKALTMLAPVARRISGIFGVRNYDLLFVQREALFFGPGIFEWIYQKLGGIPMILDLDDATYVPYVSPSYGRAGSFFKFFGKTDNLIKRSNLVVCGNRFIAEYVESKGTTAIVIPTVVDTELFAPIEKANEIPVVGWIGTHSTFSFLESCFPVLEKLAETQLFKLRIIGAGKKDIAVKGVEVENLEWNMDREIADFQSFDIGLYPVTLSSSANEQWILGKSGFKAVQYLAVGVPFVMSPVGVCAEIGEVNVTHFNAASPEDWYNSLSRLISDAGLRQKMGTDGRKYSLDHYSLAVQASVLAEAMKSVYGKKGETTD